MNQNLPRPEYPRPQFVRDQWLNLNGEWEFEIDTSDSGFERGLRDRELNQKIIVPFCPESKLSGIENTDFLEAVWYRRQVQIPQEWKGKRVLLHFQACDYDTSVWVQSPSTLAAAKKLEAQFKKRRKDIIAGARPFPLSIEPGGWVEVGRHRGGFTPFVCNLEGVAEGGETITICVRARDSHLPPQPRGKQSQRFENYGCFYTRTTGIWQTVWMEPVSNTHLGRPRFTPNVEDKTLCLQQRIYNARQDLIIKATLRDERGVIETKEHHNGLDLSPSISFRIPDERLRLWSPHDPHLYDLDIELFDESGVLLDKVQTYAGMRSLAIEGKAIKLNGEKLFQRLVLDQGYYPDGIMTAPTDDDLKRDIQISLDAGFNGARLHQKVFEERFLYHADKMGYLCWGEFPDWGCRGAWPDHEKWVHGITFAAQWIEALDRDYSHPCIVGWCPLNETYQELRYRITELDDAARAMYMVTKSSDATRPVLDASGYSHRVPETDVYDCHDYEQKPAAFEKNQAGLAEGKPFLNGPRDRPWNISYRGQPFFVSEFGGIWWNPQRANEESWGYGSRPKTVEEFYARFEGLCGVLLQNPHMFGYCYTQLTDVFQEDNGIYFFDRTPKFDLKKIRKVQRQVAAIEDLKEPTEREA